MLSELSDQAAAGSVVAGIGDPGPDDAQKGRDTDPGYNRFPLLGRRTNSPPQFGQTPCMAFVQSPQKVHSNVQMQASPRGSRLRPHFSQAGFINNAIVTFRFLLGFDLSLA
jgi:hypothetical protein